MADSMAPSASIAKEDMAIMRPGYYYNYGGYGYGGYSYDPFVDTSYKSSVDEFGYYSY